MQTYVPTAAPTTIEELAEARLPRRVNELHDFAIELADQLQGIVRYVEQVADEDGIIIIARPDFAPFAGREFVAYSVAHNGERWNATQGHYDLTEADTVAWSAEWLTTCTLAHESFVAAQHQPDAHAAYPTICEHCGVSVIHETEELCYRCQLEEEEEEGQDAEGLDRNQCEDCGAECFDAQCYSCRLKEADALADRLCKEFRDAVEKLRTTPDGSARATLEAADRVQRAAEAIHDAADHLYEYGLVVVTSVIECEDDEELDAEYCDLKSGRSLSCFCQVCDPD